jgi:hypothetical protein
MTDVSDVPKERLEYALREIRRDIARLHRDLGHGAGNEARWLFLLMWIALSNLLISAFNLSGLFALGTAAVVVSTYRVIDGMRIVRHAKRQLHEPVEPMWDTEVKL